MTLGMISSAGDLTPEWFTQLLQSVGDLDETTRVAAAEPASFGSDESMMSSLFKVALTFDGPTEAPTSLIVKLASENEGMKFVADMFRFYEREIRFYNEVLDDVSIDAPRCLHAEMYPDNQGFVLVLDEVIGCRQVDQVAGMNFDDASTTLEALADLHAPFWGNDISAMADTMLPFGSDILKQLIPGKTGGDWVVVRPMVVDTIPAEVIDLLDRVAEVWPALMDDLMGDDTLVHGDPRADNMLFRPDGSVIVLDFQLMATANGMFDPAYLISQSLDAAAQERAAELIDIYLARIASHGIEVDIEHAMTAYNASVIFNIGLALALLSSEGLADRSMELGRVMIERASREVLRTQGHLRYS